MSLIDAAKQAELRADAKRELISSTAPLFTAARRFQEAGDEATSKRVLAHAYALIAIKEMSR